MNSQQFPQQGSGSCIIWQIKPFGRDTTACVRGKKPRSHMTRYNTTPTPPPLSKQEKKDMSVCILHRSQCCILIANVFNPFHIGQYKGIPFAAADFFWDGSHQHVWRRPNNWSCDYVEVTQQRDIIGWNVWHSRSAYFTKIWNLFTASPPRLLGCLATTSDARDMGWKTTFQQKCSQYLWDISLKHLHTLQLFCISIFMSLGWQDANRTVQTCDVYRYLNVILRWACSHDKNLW